MQKKLPYIAPDTPISQLVAAGIVPEWMWRDIDPHGMYEAENILCEWDWEWGWDIGFGYTKAQLEVLAEVRKTISDGIEAFESNPQLKQRAKEEKELLRLKDTLRREYRTKLYDYFSHEEIDRIIEYKLRNGNLPFLTLIDRYIHDPRRTDRQKLRLLMAGAYTGTAYTPKELFQMHQTGTYPIEMSVTDAFPLRSMQSWRRKPMSTYGQLGEYLDGLKETLATSADQDSASLESRIAAIQEKENSELSMEVPTPAASICILRYFHPELFK